MKKAAVVMIIFFFVPILSTAYASGAMDQLTGPIDEVISILKDPQYQDEAQKEVQREKLWDVITKVFDFDKISQLALGKYRKKFDDPKMAEYTEAFTKLIGNTYLKKIQGEFKNEKVKYLEEIPGSKPDKAMVKTLIVRENAEIPVDYSMWLNNGNWRIYDVRVEGVSLVKNYRNQFTKILFKDSPDQLIERIKKKNEGNESDIEE